MDFSEEKKKERSKISVRKFGHRKSTKEVSTQNKSS